MPLNILASSKKENVYDQKACRRSIGNVSSIWKNRTCSDAAGSRPADANVRNRELMQK